MANKAKKNLEYILIDTNLYHTLFVEQRFRDTIMPILEKIIGSGYIILLPQQIVDEINRNRVSEWSINRNSPKIKRLEELKKNLLNDELDDLSAATHLVTQIDKKINQLRKDDARVSKDLISDKGARLLKKIITFSTLIPDSTLVMERTRLRALKGNPPFDKKGDPEKNCDRYIWESVIDYFITNSVVKPKLSFFTKNYSDWCIKVEEKSYTLHPFLTEEFHQKTSGSIIWSDDLTSLPSISPGEQKEVETVERDLEEESKFNVVQEKIAETLRRSNSWDHTDKVIRYAMPYIERLPGSVILDIIRASLENTAFSLGPYNQVIDASEAKIFFYHLYKRSKEINFPLSAWKDFYLGLDKEQQERFYTLRKDLEENGIVFNIGELKFIHIDDIPF